LARPVRAGVGLGWGPVLVLAQALVGTGWSGLRDGRRWHDTIPVFLAGMAATVTAGQLAVAAKRLVANIATGRLMGTILAKNALAINTGRGQAIFVGQVAVVTEVKALGGAVTHLAL
jgi:hypothetical protein